MSDTITIKDFDIQGRQTEFSPDRIYRYTLWRQWNEGWGKDMPPAFVLFVGLNPSTADETQDDPTIRRCIDFANRWGYISMCMVNLFAYRATDPKQMMSYPFPIGIDNDGWIKTCAEQAGVVVAAWGNHGGHMKRDSQIPGEQMMCLGITKKGFPKHPLYVAAQTRLINFGWIG